MAMQTGELNRRGFVAGVAAFAGLRTRADWLDFFKRDEAEPEKDSQNNVSDLLFL